MSYKTTSRRAIPPMSSPQWSMADRGMAPYRACLRKLFADLPIVAKRVGHAPRSPTVLFVHRRDHGGSRRDRLLEHRVWIVDRENHPNRFHTTALRAGVDVVLDPENRTLDRELRDLRRLRRRRRVGRARPRRTPSCRNPPRPLHHLPPATARSWRSLR